MENAFTLVGIVCALLICGGVCAIGVGFAVSIWDDSHYRAIRSEIDRAADELSRDFAADDTMDMSDVRRTLLQINRRELPRFHDMQANRGLRNQRKVKTPPPADPNSTV